MHGKKPKILITHSGGSGDILMATPIVRKIFQDRCGYCEIFVHTSYNDVFKNSPYVSGSYIPGEAINLSDFDLIVRLDRSLHPDNSRYIGDAFSFFAFGDTNIDCSIDLFSLPSDKYTAENLEKKFQDGYVVLHMKGGFPRSKVIHNEFWDELVNGVLSNTSLGVVQIGTETDLAFNGSDRLVDIRQATTFQQAKEVIARARCFIGVDSGPFHIARSTSTNIIGLFTLMRAEYVYRRHHSNGLIKAFAAPIDCYGCLELSGDYNHCYREEPECVKLFNAAEVLSTLKKLSIKPGY